MSDETDLVLGDIVIPVGSARGIAQSIEIIDNGDMRRTINGTLKNLTRQENRKFSSTINASDFSSPALAGIWRGDVIDVSCIEPLRQTVNPADTDVTLIRDPVAGTVRGIDQVTGSFVSPSSVVGRDVTFASAVTMVEFKPILTMMVTDISFDKDEYSTDESWSIQLEEE